MNHLDLRNREANGPLGKQNHYVSSYVNNKYF